MKSDKKTSYVFLLLGVGLFTLVTWRWNVSLAAWLAPVFLMRFFRAQDKLTATLPAVLLLWAASFAGKTRAWEMDLWVEAIFFLLAALPLIGSLYLDRFSAHRWRSVWQTLIFPAVYVALDFAVSVLPLKLGTVLTLAPSQFYHTELLQVSVLTGIWGVTFLVVWAAPVLNALWEAGFEARRVRLPLVAYLACLLTALLYGGVRLVAERSTAPTVRVAGVTVAHVRSYWDELIDLGTPQAQAQAFAPEMQALQDELFAESEKAALSGAKIIFWSEADAFILPENKAAFFARAQEFARQRQVYLMPSYLVLSYGETSGDNALVMITPTGEIAYTYTKTMSWYATDSDGVVHSVDTPYGRISSVICFDADFPALVRQAARQEVDILLVPAFDTYLTRLYHTEVGLLRGVEDGLSVMRMVNEGYSMAVDYRGRVLAAQDFFTTPEQVMLADLPTRGVRTPYGQLGDWFAWVCIVLAVGLTGTSFVYRRDRQER
jgi:apolipoprotein N-acyltransferase